MSPASLKTPRRKRSKIKIFIFVFLFLFILSAASVGILLFSFTSTLPSVEDIASRKISQSTKIYDRAGEVLLYEIHGEEKRTLIPYEEIPKAVKDASIAIEDQNFYSHPAFDWRGILRALFKDLLNLRASQGGSTITQQLAKNAFLSSEKTLTRKIKEVLLAIKLERQYSKDEILSLYLNQIPYGANSYGIEAASKTYFEKSAKDLNIAEAALLAAIPKAPSYYSPWGSHQDELLARKDYVLEEMARLGYIDEQQKSAALSFKFKFAPQSVSIKAPHFVMAVQDYLVKKYGEEMLEKGGLKVTTTLDWKLQEVAEAAVKTGVKRNTELYKGKNAALFAQDPKTGQVLALVGSHDYFDVENEGNFNVATQGLRQPGSSFKPLAYITAFKKGLSPDTVLFDLPTEFDTTKIPSRSYRPENFDLRFRGPMSLRNALAQSINIPAVKVLYLAGMNDVLKTAKDFGITTLTEKSRYGLSLVLGGGEVKLSEMVDAYSVFAEEGIKHEQSMILKIENSKREVLEEYSDISLRVIEPQYARIINDILSDQEARAPLFSSSLNLTVFPGYDVALKTGTTDNYIDAWSIGYTPSLVVGVWAGNNHREPLQKRGGSVLAAVPIWSEFMKEAIKNTPQETFNKPDPHTPEKPILRGDFLASKQIHSILYYINKNDPLGPAPTNPESDSQFTNWEGPVLDWAKTNLPDFNLYNQSSPELTDLGQGSLDIKIQKPAKGDFITNKFPLAFSISSDAELYYVEIFFNDSLIERILLSNTSYSYNKSLEVQNLNSQNLITVKVTNKNNLKKESSVIVYQ